MKRRAPAPERSKPGITAALTELGQGLVEADPSIRGRVTGDPHAAMALFEELLRTVFRLVFLAIAEDRDLLHPPGTPQQTRDRYTATGGFAFWRERAASPAALDARDDAWEGMKATFAALDEGRPTLGLPALGGLFAPGATPMMNAARISDRHFLRAIDRLGFFTVAGRRMPIDWREMRTEELGGGYENLLELRPAIAADGTFVVDAGAKGNARKASGSYYTPDRLVETLLDSALDPVLDRAEAKGGAEAVLDVRVVDPACGSGHFLLGAARRTAGRLALLRHPGAPDVQAARRDVIDRCIYGVDRNPIAVELAKMALWIESAVPGRPLGFLDARIRCGDALLGVLSLDALAGVPDEAYTVRAGDAKPTAAWLRRANRAERDAPLLRRAGTLDMWQDARRARDQAVRLACDAYVAAFLLPKVAPEDATAHPLAPTTRHVRDALERGYVPEPLATAIEAVTVTARPFHWPVEFPGVMLGRGGFDVVLGNPPYGAEIAPAARALMSQTHPESRTAGNTGADFIALASKILAEKGRLGLVVPKSYTYSHAWHPLRSTLLGSTRLVADIGAAWPEVALEQSLLVVANEHEDADPQIDVRTFREDADAPSRRIDVGLARDLGIIPTGINDADHRLLQAVSSRTRRTLGGHVATRRGSGLQSFAVKDGDLPILRGRDIADFACRPSGLYLDPAAPASRIVEVGSGDVVFQNIIAHLLNPTDHIKLIGAICPFGAAALDTVNIITVKPGALSGRALCAYLLSNLVNWYVYVCIYNRAVRTMHFDNYFIEKIPSPSAPSYEPLECVAQRLIDQPDDSAAWTRLNDIVYDDFSVDDACRSYLEGMHRSRVKGG